MQYKNKHGGWVSLPGEFSHWDLTTKSGWNVGLPFENAQDAYEAFHEWDRQRWFDRRVRIMEHCFVAGYRAGRSDQRVVWEEGPFPNRCGWRPGESIPDTSTTKEMQDYPQEEQMDDAQGTAPLHVTRTKLVETLQKRIDEEKAKRKEEEDKRAAARQAVLDAVAKLTPDQIANIFHHFVRVGGNKELTEWVDLQVAEQKFVSEELKPTQTETRLEKYVRVLGISEDEQVEVPPTDPLWPLL